MFRRNRNAGDSQATKVEKGAGLARGPALIMGAVLSAIGLLLFLENGLTPTGGFPDGNVRGEKVLGIETNGWTAFITTTAGVLLLFGAAQHLLAKTMSLIVGLALGACSVIALVDGDDVLGLAAANGWTALGWGIAAAILLLNTLLPRRKRTVADPGQRAAQPAEHGVARDRHAEVPHAAGDRDDTRPAADHERHESDRDRVAQNQERSAADQERHAPDEEHPAHDQERHAPDEEHPAHDQEREGPAVR